MQWRWRWTAGVAILALAACVLTAWLRPVTVVYLRVGLPVLRALHGAQTHEVMARGVRMRYLTLGPTSGPPLVLAHGLCGRKEEWLPLAYELARRGRRVYLPDLPGYGESDQPTNFSYGPGDEAEMLSAFMRAVGLQKADVGGISMGGWIVQILAYRHPEQTRRLIVMDSAGLRAPPTWDTRLFMPQNVDEALQLQHLLRPHEADAPQFVARDIVRLCRRNEWVTRRALEQMLSGRETTDGILPKLRLPVLFVWGADDNIMPLSQGERMQQLTPGSALAPIEGGGHLAPWQQPEQSAPAIDDFLK